MSEQTSWRVRVSVDGQTGTFTVPVRAHLSSDGQAWVITDLPAPEPEPWVDPQLWDARQRLRDRTEAWLLAQHRRPTGQADR